MSGHCPLSHMPKQHKSSLRRTVPSTPPLGLIVDVCFLLKWYRQAQRVPCLVEGVGSLA
jgi:hypothetical protein